MPSTTPASSPRSRRSPPFVAGHLCSGAAIPASALYQEAGIIMIAPTATNPKLTEQGFRHVFRVVNRDSEQARLAGGYLAERWAGARIGIVHDGTVYGQDLAEETRRQLDRRGVKVTQFGEHRTRDSALRPLEVLRRCRGAMRAR